MCTLSEFGPGRSLPKSANQVQLQGGTYSDDKIKGPLNPLPPSIPLLLPHLLYHLTIPLHEMSESSRMSYLSNPIFIRGLKDFLSLGVPSVTIYNETYGLNPIQDDVQDAFSHVSESTAASTTSQSEILMTRRTKAKKRGHRTTSSSMVFDKAVEMAVRQTSDVAPYVDCEKESDITTAVMDTSERDSIGTEELNTPDIATHTHSIEDDPIATNTMTVCVFRPTDIINQIIALSQKYGYVGPVDAEVDIREIPEECGAPGSEEWKEYIKKCFRVWNVRDSFVNAVDRLTTVMKIAHMYDLYVLYRAIEEEVKANIEQIVLSRGRGLKSIAHDRFCDALSSEKRKSSKKLKSDAEKCFVILMTMGAEELYKSTLSIEDVRRLPASRVARLLKIIEESGASPNFGDYKSLVTIPRKIMSAPRSPSDPVVPDNEDDVQKLLNDTQKRLRGRNVGNDLSQKPSKRVRSK